MKVQYDQEHDVLSILFKEEDGDAEIIGESEVVGLLTNADKQVVGVSISSASGHVDLSSFLIDLNQQVHEVEPDF